MLAGEGRSKGGDWRKRTIMKLDSKVVVLLLGPIIVGTYCTVGMIRGCLVPGNHSPHLTDGCHGILSGVWIVCKARQPHTFSVYLFRVAPQPAWLAVTTNQTSWKSSTLNTDKRRFTTFTSLEQGTPLTSRSPSWVNQGQ